MTRVALFLVLIGFLQAVCGVGGSSHLQDHRHTSGTCTLFSDKETNYSASIPCQFALFSPPSFDVDGLIKLRIILVGGEDVSSVSGMSVNGDRDGDAESSSVAKLTPENKIMTRYAGVSLSNPSDFCSEKNVAVEYLPNPFKSKSRSRRATTTGCKSGGKEEVAVASADGNIFQIYLSKIHNAFVSSSYCNDGGCGCGSGSEVDDDDDDTRFASYTKERAIAYALRGNCSFDQKAKVAASLGFAALLVETTDDAIFPPGGQDQGFKLDIPVLMIPTGRIADFTKALVANSSAASLAAISLFEASQCTIFDKNNNTCNSGDSSSSSNVSRYLYLFVKLFKGLPSKSSASSNQEKASVSWSARMFVWPFNACESSICVIQRLKLLFVIIVVVLLMYSYRSDRSSSANSSSSSSSSSFSKKNSIHLKYFFIFSMVFSAFMLIRIATLRIGSVDVNSGEVTLDHGETDEKIFEKLLNNVKRLGWAGYKLDHSTIRQFNLSPDNYSPNIFIHPPVFTYTSLLFNHYIIQYLRSLLVYLNLPALVATNFEFSLPVISLFYHIGTFISMHTIVYYVIVDDDRFQILESSKLSFSYAMTLLSIIICMFCPIMAFCSSKYWIDNCLLFTW